MQRSFRTKAYIGTLVFICLDAVACTVAYMVCSSQGHKLGRRTYVSGSDRRHEANVGITASNRPTTVRTGQTDHAGR